MHQLQQLDNSEPGAIPFKMETLFGDETFTFEVSQVKSLYTILVSQYSSQLNGINPFLPKLTRDDKKIRGQEVEFRKWRFCMLERTIFLRLRSHPKVMRRNSRFSKKRFEKSHFSFCKILESVTVSIFEISRYENHVTMQNDLLSKGNTT